MWRRIARLPAWVRETLRLRRHNAYLGEVQAAAVSEPFPAALYAQFLDLIQGSPGRRVCPFTESTPPAPGEQRFHLRFDIDSARCVAHAPGLLAIPIARALPCSAFFRVDAACEYRLSEHADLVHELRAAGVEVGLHTVSYASDDFAAELRRELALFRAVAPCRTLTVHGMGQHRIAVRRAMNAWIAGALPSLGLDFADCHNSLRAYGHTIQDCHVLSGRAGRWRLGDWERPPSRRVAADVMVLAHPCYWALAPASPGAP